MTRGEFCTKNGTTTLHIYCRLRETLNKLFGRYWDYGTYEQIDWLINLRQNRLSIEEEDQDVGPD